MHCGSCALNVEKALRSVPGVKQATVNGGTHRGFAATFASARPSCRLSNRHNSSDNISAVIEIPLQQIKSFKAEQEGAFIRAKGGEKNRTGRVCLSVTSEQQE
jgi:copper chaperone CopZ